MINLGSLSQAIEGARSGAATPETAAASSAEAEAKGSPQADENKEHLWEVSSGTSASPPRTGRQWIREYNRNTILRNPPGRIAMDVAANRWRLYRAEGQVERGGRLRRLEVLSHPLLQLWRRPDPLMPGTCFRYLTQVYLELNGEAFWLKRIFEPGSLVPEQLWLMPPHDVVHVPTADRPWFEMRFGAQVLPVPVDEVIWLRQPDPERPYGRGIGAAHAVADEVTQSRTMRVFQTQTFSNQARPDLIVAMPGLKNSQVRRVRSDWDQKHRGSLNRGRPSFINADTKVHLLTHTHQDLEFIEGLKLNRDTVLQNWQLSPEVVGIIENSNRATAEYAVYIYRLNCVKPRLVFLEEELGYHLVPLWGDDRLEFTFDDPVKETREFTLKQASEGLMRGALTVNDWREAQGWDPIPGGDVLLLPGNVVPTKPALIRDGDEEALEEPARRTIDDLTAQLEEHRPARLLDADEEFQRAFAGLCEADLDLGELVTLLSPNGRAA